MPLSFNFLLGWVGTVMVCSSHASTGWAYSVLTQCLIFYYFYFLLFIIYMAYHSTLTLKSCLRMILMLLYLNICLIWTAGNPRVTPEVTRDVCLLARMMAANLYFSQIEDLMFEVSKESLLPLRFVIWFFCSEYLNTFFSFSFHNVFLITIFFHSYLCGAAMMSFFLVLMNFIGLQRRMRNTI